VSTGAAALIGAVSGLLVVGSVLLVERSLRVDDPAGAVSTHGTCGAWGLLATGLFADGHYGDGWNAVPAAVAGLFHGGASQLLAQVVGIGAVALFAFATSYVVFQVLGHTIGNRVGAQAELEGLDAAELGTSAYPDFGIANVPFDSHGEPR
jgi:Amt family ammonium transporter